MINLRVNFGVSPSLSKTPVINLVNVTRTFSNRQWNNVVIPKRHFINARYPLLFNRADIESGLFNFEGVITGSAVMAGNGTRDALRYEPWVYCRGGTAFGRKYSSFVQTLDVCVCIRTGESEWAWRGKWIVLSGSQCGKNDFILFQTSCEDFDRSSKP